MHTGIFFSFSLICSYEALCECINIFLVHLCFHLEDKNEASATYIRELLHTALPHIDCKYKCKTNLFIDNACCANSISHRSLIQKVNMTLLAFYFLCKHLGDFIQSASLIILLHAGSAVDCLKFLCQRTGGGGNLPTLQCAVLALFYYANTHLQDEE